MNNKAGVFLAFSFVVAFGISGCGKQDGKEETASAKPGSEQAAVTEPRHESQLPSISKADPSKPGSAYREMKNSADATYAYYALFPTTVDFGKIAEVLSPKYREEADRFKQQDIVASLKDVMERGVGEAKNNKYYFMNVQAGRMDIKPYDFEKKSFFNPGLGINQDIHRSYSVPTFNLPDIDGGGHHGAELRFSNVKQFADVKVESQETARKMEGLRNADKLLMNVYFYANDIRVDYPGLIAQITKVEYLDPAGNVVFTQTE